MQPVYLVQGNNKQSVDDEIDLRELWDALWQGKIQIAAITSVFAIASVIIALMLPRWRNRSNGSSHRNFKIPSVY